MVALVSLLTIMVISIVVVRVATIALSHTGVSQELAHFQARSAFTGTGFTTSEAERVVNHPVRRQIIMWLMLLRNAGLVSGVSSLVLTFVSTRRDPTDTHRIILWLVLGLVVIWVFSTSRWVDRNLSRLIRWMLRRFTDLDVRDFDSLLNLSDNFSVAEMSVEEDSWLLGQELSELALTREGILILGIHRANGHFVGVPRGDAKVALDDRLIVYGHANALQSLDQRKRKDFFASLRERRESERGLQERLAEEREDALGTETPKPLAAPRS